MANKYYTQKGETMTAIRVKREDQKRYTWSHEEWGVDLNLKTPEELEDWLNRETKYYLRAHGGFYANCVILVVKTKGDEFQCYVDFYKGKFPSWYTAEEMAVLDLDKLGKERAHIKWEDWEWTTLKKEDFPVHVTEVIYLYPPQKPLIPWLFLAPDESGLAATK